MSINRVVINSSPLIVLLKSQQAQLVPKLFTEILVPLGQQKMMLHQHNYPVFLGYK